MASLRTTVAKTAPKKPLKNPCGRMVEAENAYETWAAPFGTMVWKVCKKYQAPENEAKNPNARWFCFVLSPICPQGEYADVFVKTILEARAKRIA